MSRGTLVMIGMTIGSILGGYVPVFFGVDLFSFTSVLGNGVGGLLGIWIAYKLTSSF